MGEKNWLKIDLGHIFQKGDIMVYNRESNNGRLNGYHLEISVNGADFNQIAILSSALVQIFQSVKIFQFVQIIKIAESDQFLHIREVEIWV